MAINIGTLAEAAASTVFSGTMTTTNPMSGRVSRNGVASTCGAFKAYPGDVASSDFYQTTTYTNSGAARCVTFTVTGGSCNNNAFLSIYAGSFNPASRPTNYIGDTGSSGNGSSMAVSLTAGQTVTLVMNSVGGITGCTFTIDANDAPAATTNVDSQKARALQVSITPIVAQASGAAISGAIDGAISDAFSSGGEQVTIGQNSVKFNFGAEPKRDSRVDEAFSALAYAGNANKAAPKPIVMQREWSLWLDIRDSGWKVTDTPADTGVQSSLRGNQVNATAGLGRMLTPDLLIGIVLGVEKFKYDVASLGGGLTGHGETVSSYVARRFGNNLRFDAALAWSNMAYDVTAGTASGSFKGSRWLATTGVTGDHKFGALLLEPSAKVFVLWERQAEWTDSLGTVQGERKFSTGRASAGSKIARPFELPNGAKLVPYAGLYGDFYFLSDNALPTGQPVVNLRSGWSGRVTSGATITNIRGASIKLDGELGGLGANYLVWTGRIGGQVPF